MISKDNTSRHTFIIFICESVSEFMISFCYLTLFCIENIWTWIREGTLFMIVHIFLDNSLWIQYFCLIIFRTTLVSFKIINYKRLISLFRIIFAIFIIILGSLLRDLRLCRVKVILNYFKILPIQLRCLIIVIAETLSRRITWSTFLSIIVIRDVLVDVLLVLVG